MSPVDRAGSVFEILPRHCEASPLFSLQKFRCVHMGRRAWQVTVVTVFATKITVTELEMFPMYMGL